MPWYREVSLAVVFGPILVACVSAQPGGMRVIHLTGGAQAKLQLPLAQPQVRPSTGLFSTGRTVGHSGRSDMLAGWLRGAGLARTTWPRAQACCRGGPGKMRPDNWTGAS